MNDELDDFDFPVRFARRPMQLPATLRPIWAISAITLSLYSYSRSKRSSLTRLHVLLWAIMSEERANQLIDYTSGNAPRAALTLRYDPSFDQAVTLAVSEGLLEYASSGTGVVLTQEKGVMLGQSIKDDAMLLASEKHLLDKVAKRITQDLVDRLVTSGGGA